MSLPPAVTFTSSVPLNLPPVLARWFAICVTTGTVVAPIAEPVAALFGPIGIVTREPPCA